jgi:hypothetical protein
VYLSASFIILLFLCSLTFACNHAKLLLLLLPHLLTMEQISIGMKLMDIIVSSYEGQTNDAKMYNGKGKVLIRTSPSPPLLPSIINDAEKEMNLY